MHLFDTKLANYIVSPRFRNIDFTTHMETEHHYETSFEPAKKSAERAYFAWQESKMIDMKDGKLQYILDLEQSLLDVLARMELAGVYIDKEELRNIGDEIAERSRRIEHEIYDLVGERFNINSAKQVQQILFEKLHIPTSKKIKTGFSVDNEALSFIAKDYAIAGLILEYRGLEKLRSTYIEGLLKAINPKTGRIHTTYNQTQAVTGRLSSEAPNLQNIPSGEWFANRIKSCFRPKSAEYRFLVADYSQVELRILANLSADPTLLETFRDWVDIHTRTAHFLFWEGKISSEQRRIAKSVNFGVIYGITGFGLSKTIGASPREAAEYIDKFYRTYPGVRFYYDGILDGARKNGYVETYFGRRRYIANINDANNTMRTGAEREAMNMPIQGTAADVIKIAMVQLDTFLRTKNLRSRMIMQVHDELVFEVHKDEEEIVSSEVRKVMEWVFPWVAPLLVDLHMGGNWVEAKG